MAPPSASTTAPTRGFGATRPQPRRARSRARCIAARSWAGTCSEAEPKADTSEDMGRLGIEVREVGRKALILARLQTDLTDQLHRRERETAVHEHHGTCVGGIDHHRPWRRRGTVVEPDVRIVRLVAIDADA